MFSQDYSWSAVWQKVQGWFVKSFVFSLPRQKKTFSRCRCNIVKMSWIRRVQSFIFRNAEGGEEGEGGEVRSDKED